MKTEEKKFVNDFMREARKLGMITAKIPDPKGCYINQEYRPFDFVLITKTNTFCIEAKFGNNKLLSHQKATAKAIEKLNSDTYWIIRKKELKSGTWYTVEKFYLNFGVEKYDVICKSQNLIDIVNHFNLIGVWSKNET